jgi:hypothetical protein
LATANKAAALELLQAPSDRRDQQRGGTAAIGDLVRLAVLGDAPKDLAGALTELANAHSLHVLHGSTWNNDAELI